MQIKQIKENGLQPKTKRNLNTALDQTVDLVLKTYDPDQIYLLLGDNLRDLGLSCAVISTDPQTHQVYHEYHNLPNQQGKSLNHFPGQYPCNPRAPSMSGLLLSRRFSRTANLVTLKTFLKFHPG